MGVCQNVGPFQGTYVLRAALYEGSKGEHDFDFDHLCTIMFLGSFWCFAFAPVFSSNGVRSEDPAAHYW